MIYLITGAPGTGKSLYAVSKLVQELVAQKLQKDGKEISRRLVVDNIPNLLLPHELMDPGTWEDGQVKAGEGQGVWNWQDWCRPGDVIVIDEVQRHWRPRGNGTKVPPQIAALETHRHKGVDFVIITQSPMLVDQNVRRLVNRHQHVRRLFGMQRAIIYDFDSCNQTLSLSQATAKTFFNYPKSAYELYKSSELHTKPKQKIPLILALPVLAIVGLFAAAPGALATMKGVMGGKGISQAAAPAAAASSPKPVASLPPLTVPGAPPGFVQAGDNTPKAPPLSMPLEKQKFAGCIAVNDRCGCFDNQGAKVDVDVSICRDTTRNDSVKLAAFEDSPHPVTLSPGEQEALAFAFLKNKRGSPLRAE